MTLHLLQKWLRPPVPQLMAKTSEQFIEVSLTKTRPRRATPRYLEREWLPSWYMCGLYWAMMVMVSHCCPMMSRACCSVAFRKLIPLY